MESIKASVLDDLSPQDLYWDPRYNQYFFVGNLKPLPGEAPSDATNGADGASFVELVPNAPTRKPSILVTEGRRPVKRRHHVSWLYERAQTNVPEPANSPRDSRRLVACSCTLCAFAVLLILVVALGVSGALDDAALAAGVVEATTSADDSLSERYPRHAHANAKLQVSSLSSAATSAVANSSKLVSVTNDTSSYASDAAEE